MIGQKEYARHVPFQFCTMSDHWEGLSQYDIVFRQIHGRIHKLYPVQDKKKTNTAVPPTPVQTKETNANKTLFTDQLIDKSAFLILYQSRKVSSCKKKTLAQLDHQLRIANIISYVLHTCVGR